MLGRRSAGLWQLVLVAAITISLSVLAMHQLAVNHLFVAPATIEPHATQHRPFAVEMQQVALIDHVPTGHHGQSLTFGPAAPICVGPTVPLITRLVFCLACWR
jgi:hypothetical protein